MGSNTYDIGNFPNEAGRLRKTIRFTDDLSISSMLWVITPGGGSIAPSSCNDARGGGATFTNGAADDDSLEYWSQTEFIRFNVLGGIYKFLFSGVTLSDDDQIEALFGIGKKPATSIHTLLTDAFFLRTADGETTWRTGHAFNAAQVADYSESQNGTVDTDEHSLGIRVELSSLTLGTGEVTFYVDGDAIGAPYPSTTLPHDEEMAILHGSKNGEGVAKSYTMKEIVIDVPVAA